jgi:hypothetical protein
LEHTYPNTFESGHEISQGEKMDENYEDPEPEDKVATAGTETESDEAAEREDVLLTAEGLKFLKQTKPWVRFLAVMVFIVVAFTVIGALIMLLVGVAGNFFGAGSETFGILPGEGMIIGFVYLVIGILYITPGIFLFRYATAIKVLESACKSQALENALKYQRSFWRYIGILTVIYLIVVAAIIAFSFAVGVFMWLNK